MDLVRAFYEAVNVGDLDRIAAFYDRDCIIEHVFSSDAGVYRGPAVREKWADELTKFAGALPGGHRVDVTRIAGIETGWGWVRADWSAAVRDCATGAELRRTGYSHFLIEDGLIRRHRTAVGQNDSGSRFQQERTGTDARGRFRPVVGVGAVILLDGKPLDSARGKRVVLVKRKHEPLAGQWSLPGGGVEWGEPLEVAVAREVLEETGLVVDVGPLIEVFDRILVDEQGEVRYHFVLADYLCKVRGGALAAGTDAEDVAAVPPSALEEYRVAEKARAVIERALQLRSKGDSSR